MTDQIRNIYCIGRNYRLHALELGNEVPESPLVFTKPSHAVAPMNGNVVTLPAGRGEVHFELELVLHIGKALHPGMKPDECVDGLALGLDLTLRDVQSKLKAKGQPWLEAKGFKNSAPLGGWMPFPGEEQLKAHNFKLIRNGEQAQLGNSGDMLFGISELITHIDNAYGLGPGDLIFTGTPAGVAALQDGDVLEAYWNDQLAANCTISLV
ncbi:fumarylacetoacetate hydrolase family protein [Paenibacillus sp. NPDC058174]|uniref:fumarylacetoacetate hydrolase family protein n=1 Tax=Paenibacillus sp. NPDC058174 TaxID=3346366 RepID=UPI0036DDD0AA